MALPDAVLKKFFDSRKRPLFTPTSEKERTQQPPFPRYRVFDDPILKEELLEQAASFLKGEEEKLKTNLGQSQDKVRTDLEILENTPKADLNQPHEKPETNSGQSQDILKTNLGQSQDKVRINLRPAVGGKQVNLGQSQDKLKTEPRTIYRTNLGQSQDKVRTACAFSSLVGLQRKITLIIYEACKISRSKITDPLSIEYFATACETTKFSIQKTIQRLEKKGVVSRKTFKNGRGGWTQYELSDSAFQESMNEENLNKLRTNLGQTQDKPKTEPRTELRTTLSSSSSSNLNTTTTTTTGEGAYDLPPDWQMFDFSPLEEFGFGKPHLLQIQRKGLLNLQIVQDSVNAFAFDLKRNQKAKTLNKTPLEFFMGILCKGSPYVPPENYESPREEAMRLYAERLQALKEKREKTEKLAMELAFEEWFSGLTLENQKKIFPSMLELKNAAAKRASFMHHFRENIWPEERVRNGA